MTTFWQRWLEIWCVLIVLFGLVLAGAAEEGTDRMARALFDILDGPGEPSFDAHMRFSVSLMGCVSIGWGITLFAAIRAVIALGQKAGRPIWSLLTIAVLAWYLVDSYFSVRLGFWMNAISNTGLLAGFLVPLFATGALRR